MRRVSPVDPRFEIELSYRLARDGRPRSALSHPLVAMLRAVRDGGSIKAAASALGVSYRHAWGSLKAAETEFGGALLTWVQGEGSTLTDRGHALVNAEDLALSRLAPQIESLRAELARAFDAALGPASQTLTVFASHDLALTRLRERAHPQRLYLDLRFLGTVDCLRALAAGRCLVAGFHAPLATPAGSAYACQLKPLLQPGVHKLLGFARRWQGLIVRNGNPFGLQSMSDLARAGLRFVGRQPGSGTGLLTEALLRGANLEAQQLHCTGVEDSQLATAAAVACNLADVGIGTEAAAAEFGLHFVPLVQERYAFVCLKPALEHPAVQALQALLADPAWLTQLAAMPGYSADRCGEVLRLTQALPWWGDIVGSRRRVGALTRR